MGTLQKIENNIVRKSDTKEEIRLSSFWKEDNVVIFFMRRFGWLFCRLAARELSLLQPRLAAADCRLLAVGLEDVGLQEFLDGGFFKGDVVVDNDQRCYKALGFRRMNLLTLGPALLAKVSRDAMGKAKQQGIANNLKGDGFQNGGLLVVAAGGRVLYEYRQENPADHAPNSDILQALNLSPDPTPAEAPPSSPSKTPAPVCTDDVCSMPAK